MHARFKEIEALDTWKSVMIGYDYAERFVLERNIFKYLFIGKI